MEGMMNVAVYDGIQKVHMEQRPIPQITENDVLVKVLRAGICGSDTGAYLHGGMYYGIMEGCEFGHEMVGKVVEKGANVADDINVGDIVFVDPTKCKNAGIVMGDMAGAFSEYVNVETAKQGVNVYKLADDIDLDTAAITEPLSVGTQGAVCMNPTEKDNIVVLGAGAIGLSAAAGLIARGLKNVVVVDRDANRLAKAAELGAMTINTTECVLRDKLCETFGCIEMMPGSKTPIVNIYVDCAGAPALLEECFSYSFVGTKYIVVSVYFGNVTLAGSTFMMASPVVTSSVGYTHDTILEVIDHITNNKTAIKTMVTKKFAHKDFPEAIATAASGSDIKVVIDYEM